MFVIVWDTTSIYLFIFSIPYPLHRNRNSQRDRILACCFVHYSCLSKTVVTLTLLLQPIYSTPTYLSTHLSFICLLINLHVYSLNENTNISYFKVTMWQTAGIGMSYFGVLHHCYDQFIWIHSVHQTSQLYFLAKSITPILVTIMDNTYSILPVSDIF